MTEMLEKAIAEVKLLSEADQDAIAQFILEELEDERRWEASFSHPKSPLLIEKLLAEAEAEDVIKQTQVCEDTEAL